jgi:hypothetical protein
MKSTALALPLALSLAGCAHAPSAPEPTWQDKLAASGWAPGAEVDTVPNFSIRNFDALDASHLVVHVGTARRVLVTTGPGCVGLDTVLRIAYQGDGLTLSRLDLLRVFPRGQPPTSCRVEALQLLVPPVRPAV